MASPENITSARQLSVVVGSVESSRSISSCLEAISMSCRELDAEVIVVDAGGEPAVIAATRRQTQVRLIEMPGDTLTPRLWSEGLAASSGSIVAFTTGHCFVGPRWASELVAATNSGAAAAGGPLRLEDNASALDAAIFFLRYSAYIEGKPNGPVEDIAGDNAAYSRSSIPDGSWSREEGFWERDVNRAIRDSGQSLVWVDGAVCEFGRSFSFSSICHHRFFHGRLFGRSRVAKEGESRLKIVAGSVAVPFLLAVRAGRRVWGNASYRAKYFVALPLTLVIAACWAAGEAVGAMEASVADRR